MHKARGNEKKSSRFLLFSSIYWFPNMVGRVGPSHWKWKNVFEFSKQIKLSELCTYVHSQKWIENYFTPKWYSKFKSCNGSKNFRQYSKYFLKLDIYLDKFLFTFGTLYAAAEEVHKHSKHLKRTLVY